MTTDLQSPERVRERKLDHLQAEVRRREDQFLVEGGDYARNDEGWESWVERPELNEYAIAEWAYGLLERQMELMVEAVDRALSNDNDNDTEEKA